MATQFSSQSSISSALEQSQQKDRTINSLVQNLSAFVFGAIVIFAVGFLPMEAAHNAAHDSRHSLAFPCH